MIRMNRVQRLWMDLPLATKIASLSILLGIIGIVAATTLQMQRERASYHDELEDQARLLLETLPLTIQDDLYQQDVNGLEQVMRQISSNPNVTLFEIYNSSNQKLVVGDNQDAIFSKDADPTGVRLGRLGRTNISMEWHPDQLVAGRAIWLGNQRIGAVAIGLSTAALNEKIQALTYQSIGFSLVVLLFSVLLTLMVAQQITNPIRELTQVADRMAGGDLKQRVKRQSQDEVGRLGHAFNQMAESIHQRETDLQDFARGLERAVQERTQELEQQNVALNKANDDLVVTRKQAEDANRLKSEFLASMSHELRTPLNAIMGFSQVLLAGVAGALNDKQTERIDRIFKSGQTLLDMINDILDLSKIEAGRMELLLRPFGVSAWVGEIRSQLEGLATEKGLEFAVTIDPDMPSEIVGDAVRLKQIATNLLSNAIKFTEKGKVSLEIKKQPDNMWSVAVTDTGMGIPPHALEYIFDEFRQVDGSSQRKHGGTGLGLAIVRKLAVLMGGQVKVTSTVNEGSTFIVTLPLVVEEPQSKTAEKQES